MDTQALLHRHQLRHLQLVILPRPHLALSSLPPPEQGHQKRQQQHVCSWQWQIPSGQASFFRFISQEMEVEVARSRGGTSRKTRVRSEETSVGGGTSHQRMLAGERALRDPPPTHHLTSTPGDTGPRKVRDLHRFTSHAGPEPHLPPPCQCPSPRGSFSAKRQRVPSGQTP